MKPKLMKALALMLAALPALATPLPVCAAAVSASPQHVADELLAADRAFATAATSADTVAGLSAMFDADVIMPLPDATFAQGRAAAIAALRGNPFNLASHAEWAPVRAGVSADGQHGFTFGFIAAHGRDGTVGHGKYLAYWVRRPEGWRVAAYRRVPRPEGEISTALMAPSLPIGMGAGAQDAAVLAQGLRDAEQAFSDTAQRIGLGPAFRATGAPDAMNMGREAGFLFGNEAIAALVDSPGPGSPVSWNSDGVLVASSGDLGVSWGMIRVNGPAPEGRPAAVPFFTIWRRAAPDQPWRYIAE